MERYETAIVGTGPAGLEAAITAKLRNKKLILIGSKKLSPKVEKAHEIRNYLGIPNASGEVLGAAYAKHLAAMDIEISEGRVSAIYSMGSYFALQLGESMIEAETVILATGVVTAKPLPGEDENLGNGVSYCATCDAALYKGKSAVVLSYGKNEEAEADFLSERAEKVTYIAMYAEEANLAPGIEIVSGVVPLSVERQGEKMLLHTDGGDYEADGIFILRDALAPDKLVPGLRTEGAHVAVDRQMRTNIPGLFACGDICGKPYQYIKSAGEGNVAALSAVAYLDEKKRGER